MRRFFITLALLMGGLVSVATAADWPRFRGPNGTGISTEKGIPTQWTEKDYLWKTEIPGKGYSSPIVSKGKIFLQSSSINQDERMMVCVDSSNGKILWSKSLPGGPAKTHAKNTPASNTPTADGERVYAVFWDGNKQVLTAWDYEGKLLWNRDLGTFTSQHGSGMSPIVVGNKVIVNNDQDGKAHLQVFDSKTGNPVWEKKRDHERACYSTPFLQESVDSGPDLIVASTGGITGYDISTGKELWNYVWTFDKMRLRTVACPIMHQGMIFAASGDGGGDRNMIAIKIGGSGDITKNALVWQKKIGTPYVPCPLAKNGLIFWITDKENLAVCVDAKTGEEKYRERLGGDSVSASPVMIDGNIYSINEKGLVSIFKAEGTFDLVGKTEMKEPVFASPAVADGRLIIRGQKNLYAIGKK